MRLIRLLQVPFHRSSPRVRVLLFAILLSQIAACGGDSGSPGPTAPGPPPGTGGLSATIDGNSWTASNTTANRTASLMSIIGWGPGGVAVNLHLTQPAEGEFRVGPQDALLNLNIGEGTRGWVASGGMGSGVVTITTLTDDRVAGTFEFTAVLIMGSPPPQTRVVTAGTFDMPLSFLP
jgi:hypothetical protein